MAIFYSTQAADQSTNNDYTDASKRTVGDVFGTSPMNITVGLTTGMAANDIIILSYLPSGIWIDPHNSYIYTPGGAGTLTLDIGDFDIPTEDWDDLVVGDARNADRWADGINAASAGFVLFSSGTVPAETLAPAATTSPSLLCCTLATEATSTDETLNVVVSFKHIGV